MPSVKFIKGEFSEVFGIHNQRVEKQVNLLNMNGIEFEKPIFYNDKVNWNADLDVYCEYTSRVFNLQSIGVFDKVEIQGAGNGEEQVVLLKARVVNIELMASLYGAATTVRIEVEAQDGTLELIPPGSKHAIPIEKESPTIKAIKKLGTTPSKESKSIHDHLSDAVKYLTGGAGNNIFSLPGGFGSSNGKTQKLNSPLPPAAHDTLKWNISGVTPGNSNSGKLYCKSQWESREWLYIYKRQSCLPEYQVAKVYVGSGENRKHIEEINASGISGTVDLGAHADKNLLATGGQFEIPLGATLSGKYNFSDKVIIDDIQEVPNIDIDEAIDTGLESIIKTANPDQIEKIKKLLAEKSEKPKKKRRRGRRVLP